jgi:GST-like protein
LYGVLNHQLEKHEFVAHDYSIADMAIYPWIVPWQKQGQDLNQFPHLKRWFEMMGKRPAVVRAYELAHNINTEKPMTDEAKKILFGQSAR